MQHGRDRSAGPPRPDVATRSEITSAVDRYAAEGLRVLGVATRLVDTGEQPPETREEAEVGFCFLGLVAMLDPPLPRGGRSRSPMPYGGCPDHRRDGRPRPHRDRNRQT